jgi:hypothetical protein
MVKTSGSHTVFRLECVKNPYVIHLNYVVNVVVRRRPLTAFSPQAIGPSQF